MSKYKIGDKLICVGNDEGHSDGYGFFFGAVFIVDEITMDMINHWLVYWGDGTLHGGGVYEHSVREYDARPWSDSKLIFKFV